MKKVFPLILIIGGLVLMGIVWTGYQKAERAKRQTDTLREMILQQNYPDRDEVVVEIPPESEYDSADLDQTPPGVTPFIPTSVCFADWGNHLRQYCAGGDEAPLELIEGGDDQAETMRIFNMCLNELLHQIDTYETDLRPMDSTVEQNEANRKDLACKLTTAYGNSPIFDDGSIYYMVKEHMESGNIERLENR